MPVEIKELVIRTVVAPSGPVERAAPVEADPARASQGTALDTEALVQECVRQVMRLLAQQRER